MQKNIYVCGRIIWAYININCGVIYRIYRALVCLAYFLNKFIY